MTGEGLATWAPYCGVAPGPGEWLARWNLDPLLLAGFAAAAIAFLMLGRSATAGQRRWFWASFALAAILFVSPLCALTSALFSVRVVHHILLVAVLAPMLALALPVRRRGNLAAATGVQALTIWLWHAPSLYAWSLAHDGVYWLMQASLIASATWFWVSVRAAPPLSAVAGLLATMVQMGLLGALITFAAGPLYAPHLATTAAWGMTPLEDQQLGGLVMWAPAAAIYLAAALRIAYRWLGSSVPSAAPAEVPAR